MKFWIIAAFAIAMAGCGAGGADAKKSYAVYFGVAGLSGAGLELTATSHTETRAGQVKLVQSMVVAANGKARFETPLARGSQYQIAITKQPQSQTCTLTGQQGVSGTNERDAQIRCVNDTSGVSYRVQFRVEGLSAGASAVLQNNLADDTTVTQNGTYWFAERIPAGNRFDVSMLNAPAGQACGFVNALTLKGIVVDSDITNIVLHCHANYSVSVNVLGLATGKSFAVSLNGAEELPLNQNGASTFTTQLGSGENYSIAIVNQPAGQACNSVSGTGTVANENVVVTINCATVAAATYSVGVNVAGLTGSGLVVRNTYTGGSKDMPINSNGAFVFAEPLAGGTTYSVTVLVQPTSQHCIVASGNGVIANANVTANITCSGPHSVGGSVIGLSGAGMALQINGAERKPIGFNGTFSFSTKYAAGIAYNVSVYSQPRGQSCVVSNGSGTIPTSDITNIGVSCAIAAPFDQRIWSAEEMTDTANNGISPVKSVIDKNGNIYMFWGQADGTILGIYWRRYDAATASWSVAEKLASASLLRTPEVAVDGNGNLFIAWIASSTGLQTDRSVYTQRFDAALHTWGVSDAHELSADPVTEFALAAGENGDAALVWIQKDQLADSVWARRFDSGNGRWLGIPGDDFRIETLNIQTREPAVAMSAAGNILVAFVAAGTPSFDLRINYFDKIQAQWLDTANPYIVSVGTGDVSNPSLTLDGNAAVTMLWAQRVAIGAQESNVVTTRYTMSSKTVSPVQVINTTNTRLFNPRLAANAAGSVVVVWTQDDGTGNFEIVGSVRSASQGFWLSPLRIFSATAGAFAAPPEVAMDDQGNAVVLVTQVDNANTNRTNVMRATYNLSAGSWSASSVHENSPFNANSCGIAADGAAKFISIWNQDDGVQFKPYFRLLQ